MATTHTRVKVQSRNAGFLATETLERYHWLELGEKVLIHETSVLVNMHYIKCGNHSRIDAFAVVSAGSLIDIGNNVHIGSHCSLMGHSKIVLQSFSGLSPGVRIFSSTDDYSGETMTNPTAEAAFKNVKTADVLIGRHTIVGAGTIILPGVTIGEGCAIGALSLIKDSLEPWGIYAGVPARRIGERSKALLKLEAKMSVA